MCVVYLAQLYICITICYHNGQNLCSVCPAYTDRSTLATTPLARLVKLRPLIDQTCFEFISVSYLVVCYFQRRIFNITKLLYCVAPSVESMMQM